MVEIDVRLTKIGLLYLPKAIRESLGWNLKIIPNASAALIFPRDMPYEDVLESLEIIKADIKHRISLRNRKKKLSEKPKREDGTDETI